MLFLTLLVTTGFAQEVGFYAQVNSDKITLGEAVRLQLTVEGADVDQPIEIPAIEDIETQYLGISSNVSIVNGKYSSSKTFNYQLFPLKTGVYQIPSIETDINGKTYSTRAILIDVKDSTAPPTQAVSQAQQQEEAGIKDRVFLVVKVPKNEVYVNEPLPVKIMLIAGGLNLSDIQYPEMDTTGFVMGNFPKPAQYEQMINGVVHNILEFDTVIYPTRTGELLLGPATTRANLIVQAGSRFPSQRMNGLFQDEFFRSVFGGGQRKAIALTSNEEKITVRPLPEDGKPANFSGGVGNLNFKVEASPTNVKVGDPITLRMSILGSGNKQSARFPDLTDLEKDFKLYEPQIKDEGSERYLEQVIIPKRADVTEIPKIQFSFFNVDIQQYQTIARGPIDITVKDLEPGERLNVVGLNNQTVAGAEESLGEDIVFIKDAPGQLIKKGARFYKNALFYVFVAISFAAWVFLLIYYQQTQRLQTDAVYAKRMMAPKKAKKGLLQARKFIDENKKQEFYDTLFKTLQHYLGNKLHLPIGTVTLQTIKSHKKFDGVDKDIIESIRHIFEESDLVRYAAGQITEETMNNSFAHAERVIDYLERNMK